MQIRTRLVVAALIAGLSTALAHAQAGNRSTMVMDDGQQRHVLHFSTPDFQRLFAPDATLADLPLFTRYLLLSEPQQSAVKAAIQRYTDALETLRQDENPLKGDGVVSMRVGGPPEDEADRAPHARKGAPGAHDPSQDDEMAGEEGGGDQGPLGEAGIDNTILEELRAAGFQLDSMDDFPYEPNVAVAVMMDQEGDAPPKPSFNVGISFAGADDTMSDETREKLKAVAEKAANRVTEQLKNAEFDMISVGGPGAGPGDPLPPDQEIANRWAEIQALRERVAEFQKKKHTLMAALVNDIKALLAESQLARWPACDRALTRAKTLPWGVLDGETVDLLAVIERLDDAADIRKATTDTASMYELQLHEALTRRNKLLDTTDAEVDTALYDQNYDRAVSLTQRLTRAHEAVRNVNDQYREQFCSNLDPQHSAALRHEALTRGYPRIYRETLAGGVFKDVLDMQDLDSGVRSSAAGMRDGYASELKAMNNRLYRIIRKHQAAARQQDIERLIAESTGEPVENTFTVDDDKHPLEGVAFKSMDEAIADGFRARRSLDVRYMQSLYAMLTPQQRAALPRIPEADVARPVVGASDWNWSTPHDEHAQD